MRQRYLDLIVREQARATVRRARRGGRLAARHLRVARLPRGRDADAADHARRRLGPSVRHALERLRHRAVPAHRARAVPQARRRRRHRARLRDQPQLPQRGRRLDALPRVRDARGVPGLRRLQPDGRPHAGADPECRGGGHRIARGHLGRRHRVRPRRRLGPHLDVRVAVARPRAWRSPRRRRSTSWRRSPTARASRCSCRPTASTSRSCGSTSSRAGSTARPS